MQDFNLLERLVQISPGMEVWWDSSPLIFASWCRRMLAKADPGDREIMRRQFARMYDPENPERQLFRGVTTNPILSMDVIRDDEPRWRSIAADIMRAHEGVDEESLFWLLYKEVVRRGSEMYLPLFEASRYREGFVSAQVDPRKSFDGAVMLEQALELRSINPNVMIKIPGTTEGYGVIEELTARGVPTNNTLTFVLSQLLDCAESVRRGVERAKTQGVELSKWRSVITYMLARFGELGGLLQKAGSEQSIELSEGDVRLAELAILKKAYRLIKDGGYQSKLLPCSLRNGPTINRQLRSWHLEEMTGADLVVTVPPFYVEEIVTFPSPENIEYLVNRIEVDTPKELLDRLMRIPYFERGYEENGYTRAEYNSLPGLLMTAEEFSGATNQMVEFSRNCLANKQGA
ncbi:MAG: transaldolase family protein [Thermoleophilia bacterium]